MRPDNESFLEDSLACDHIAGDVYFYFRYMCQDSDNIIDSYVRKENYESHMECLLDMCLYLENEYVTWATQNKENAILCSIAGLILDKNGYSKFIEDFKPRKVNQYDKPISELIDESELYLKKQVQFKKRSLVRYYHNVIGSELNYDNITDTLKSIVENDYKTYFQEWNTVFNSFDTCSFTINYDNDIKKAKENVKKKRNVFKRSMNFLSSLIGMNDTKMFISGDKIRIDGRYFVYEISKKASSLLNSDSFNGTALSIFDKADDRLHICDICIYTNKTPILDHVASIIMHIKTDNELEILKKGNLFNFSNYEYGKKQIRNLLPEKNVADFTFGYGIFHTDYICNIDEQTKNDTINEVKDYMNKHFGKYLNVLEFNTPSYDNVFKVDKLVFSTVTSNNCLYLSNV